MSSYRVKFSIWSDHTGTMEEIHTTSCSFENMTTEVVNFLGGTLTTAGAKTINLAPLYTTYRRFFMAVIKDNTLPNVYIQVGARRLRIPAGGAIFFMPNGNLQNISASSTVPRLTRDAVVDFNIHADTFLVGN